MDIFIHEIYESEQEYILHASENDVNGTTELANKPTSFCFKISLDFRTPKSIKWPSSKTFCNHSVTGISENSLYTHHARWWRHIHCDPTGCRMFHGCPSLSRSPRWSIESGRRHHWCVLKEWIAQTSELPRPLRGLLGRAWRVPATRPDPNFFLLPELFFKISEFRVFPSRLFPSRPLQIFYNHPQIPLFSCRPDTKSFVPKLKCLR